VHRQRNRNKYHLSNSFVFEFGVISTRFGIMLSLPLLALTLFASHGVLTTVYGVRPRGMVGLDNKNTADARGDIYFLLSRLAVTYQMCQLDPSRFDCHCEITCDDNVITRYNLTTYTPFNFTGYRNCNPTKGSTVSNYSYYCDGEYSSNVGAVQTTTFPWYANKKIPNFLNIWKHKFGVQIGGVWYSTMAESKCTNQTKPECAWEARATKVIDKSCMVSHFTQAAMSADPLCFSGCPNHPYNSSTPYVKDSCWIECFVDTVFQMQALQLEEIWLTAFSREDREVGGCPHSHS
jgi:hypothetical protein